MVEKVRCFIDQNFSKELSLDFLASIASMSKFYLSRRFKQMKGMTCCQYIVKVRVREARRLLIISPYTVGEIGFAVGYKGYNLL